MKRVAVTQRDIALVTQPIQKRYLLIEVLSQSKARLFTLDGEVISCSAEISQDSAVRRTASLTMRTDEEGIKNILSINMNCYVRIQAGIEDNKSLDTKWWCQGIFIINQNSLNVDENTKTFSISLSDKMLDFTGDRRGTLHAYSSILKNQQRFDETMINLVEKLGGCNEYDITPIHPSKTQSYFWDAANDDDYLIPYEMDFPAGVTVYEVLEQLVNVYPNWEIFFDSEGTFVCQAKLREGDSGFVALDDEAISLLKISESPQIFDVTKIKNSIEVWGKDGAYYGEAVDDEIDSPFSVSAIGTIRGVFSGGNYDHIYDRYKDVELGVKQENHITDLQKQIGELDLTTEDGKSKKKTLSDELQNAKKDRDKNIKITGADMAQQWAEQLLHENTKLQYTSSITLLGCPFLNETGFKIAYRDEATHTEKTYIVTGISHDYVACTTTLTCVQFCADTTANLLEVLENPVIENYYLNERELTAAVSPVENAERYSLYIDGHLAVSDNANALSFTFNKTQTGKHTIQVKASAKGYLDGASEIIKIEV